MSALFDDTASDTLDRHRTQLGAACKIKEGDLLLELFISKGLVTEEEEELILSEKTKQLRMGQLIDSLSRRMTTARFKVFVDAIGDREYVNNPGLKEVLIQYYEGQGGKYPRD